MRLLGRGRFALVANQVGVEISSDELCVHYLVTSGSMKVNRSVTSGWEVAMLVLVGSRIVL